MGQLEHCLLLLDGEQKVSSTLSFANTTQAGKSEHNLLPLNEEQSLLLTWSHRHYPQRETAHASFHWEGGRKNSCLLGSTDTTLAREWEHHEQLLLCRGWKTGPALISHPPKWSQSVTCMWQTGWENLLEIFFPVPFSHSRAVPSTAPYLGSMGGMRKARGITGVFLRSWDPGAVRLLFSTFPNFPMLVCCVMPTFLVRRRAQEEWADSISVRNRSCTSFYYSNFNILFF